jgi:hypothetical protein
MLDFLVKSNCEIYIEESVFNKVKDNKRYILFSPNEEN